MAADGTYVKPGFFTARVFNPAVKFLVARLGFDMKGARVLSVRGRATGVWHSTPVNPLRVGDQRYLVSARGETQWVRNIRVSRTARITRGRETETVHVEEVADPAKPPILRAYLRAWEWEVGRFFDGIGPSAPEADLARIAPKHPVFRVVP